MRKVIIFMGLTALFVTGCGSSDTASTPGTASTTGTPVATTEPKTPATTGTADYAAVQTVFTAKCAGCHGATHPKGGINLTGYEAVLKGGKEGPIVVVGNPDGSLLVKAIKGAPGAKKMPPGSPLDPAQIKTVEDWVKAGAKA